MPVNPKRCDMLCEKMIHENVAYFYTDVLCRLGVHIAMETAFIYLYKLLNYSRFIRDPIVARKRRGDGRSR